MSVKQLRREKKWSQVELAGRAGISRNTIINMESGRAVSLVVRNAVCQALGTEDVDIVVSHPVRLDVTK